MEDGGISNVLSVDDVVLGRATESKAEAIEFAGQMLVDREAVKPGYVQGMHDREETVSTYLGNGVALPHGTLATKDEILETRIVIVQYPEGIDWGLGPVHLVVGLAAVGEDHVAVLSQLAEVLQDEDLCAELWVTDDAEGLVGHLTSGGAPSEVEITITNDQGLHARPAALLVERIQALSDTSVTITVGEKSANAASIMSVLALGAKPGDVATVSAEGDEADEALEIVEHILTTAEADL